MTLVSHRYPTASPSTRRRPGTPRRPSAPRSWTVSRTAGGRRAGPSRRRGRRRTRQLARVHDTGVSRPHRRHRRPGDGARSRHLHVARDARDRAAGGRARRWTPCRSVARQAAGTMRWRWCGRPGITPSATARWGSASTTTWPWPRPMRGRRARHAWRSSTTTFITATARSTSSSAIPTRAVRLDASVSRTIRAPARPDEIGKGEGEGFTVNAPLEVGAVDEDYRLVFAEAGRAGARQFEPDLVLVSAGFDAHERDPLGGMRLTTAAFAAMTMRAARGRRRVLPADASSRVVEGGYDLQAFDDSLRGCRRCAWLGPAPATRRWPAPGIAVVPAPRRTRTSRRRDASRAFWRL